MDPTGAIAEEAPSPVQAASSFPMGRAIGTAAIVIMLGNLTGSLLGFARQAVIAKVFGDTLGTSAFFAASVVPQMFYDLTIGAAISAALIPTFSEILERRGREDLWRVFGSVLALAWLVLAVTIGILLIAASPLMSAILPGYHALHRHGGLDLSVKVVRILIPSLFFLGTSAVLLSTLYSLRRFKAPAFAPSLYHLGVIGGAIGLARPLGIVALPVGALIGSAGQAAAQVPALLRMRPKLYINLKLTPELRRIIFLYLPVAAGLLVSIAGQVIDLRFKSQLHSRGAITDMQFGTTLTQFPIGIVVAAMSFAVLPSISADAAFQRMSQFKDTLALGMKLVLFITIPAAIGYIALATPIVSLLFEHGHFHAAATSRTAAALTGYAIQIPFVGIDQLLIFSFYARKNTVTPMLIGVVGVFVYIVSALLLMPRFQILGLALANTIQNSLHGIILLFLLLAAIGSLAGRGIFRSLGIACLAALAMAIIAAFSAYTIGQAVEVHRLWGQAIRVLIPMGLAAATYIAVAALLRSPELGLLAGVVRQRLRPG